MLCSGGLGTVIFGSARPTLSHGGAAVPAIAPPPSSASTGTWPGQPDPAVPGATNSASTAAGPGTPDASEPASTPTTATAPTSPSLPAVYYRNCGEARAAGAAPIVLGEPGYRSELDTNHDGVACDKHDKSR
ncbi:excalibur calcium-binding domain-containing protein [Dactylosporangium darangshiense]|uniref:excalibur calcium-binding domain-containing protein n=1 Tax=Dactylosporangium darangshiense TaxID=579108 RepID=UPI00362F5E51